MEIGSLKTAMRELQDSLEEQIHLAQKTHQAQWDKSNAELVKLREELKAEKERAALNASVQASMMRTADIIKAASAAREAKNAFLQPEQIIAKLRVAVGLDPNVAEYHIDLSKTLYATGDYDAAREASISGIERHPLDATLPIVKGACFFSMADRILKSGPKGDPSAARHAAGLFAMAEMAYHQALANDPANAYALYNLALTIQTSDSDNSRLIVALRAWDEYFAVALTDPEQVEWVKMAREIKKSLDSATP